MDENLGLHWSVKAVAPPKLTKGQWILAHLLGLVLLVMAILQLINFTNFADNFGALQLPWPNVWAAGVIVAELWGAVGFLKVKFSWLFRAISNTLAVAVALFWFIYSLRAFSGFAQGTVVVNGKSALVSNFFGKYITQGYGWWPVIEATVFLFLVLYAVEVMRQAAGSFKAKRR